MGEERARRCMVIWKHGGGGGGMGWVRREGNYDGGAGGGGYGGGVGNGDIECKSWVWG